MEGDFHWPTGPNNRTLPNTRSVESGQAGLPTSQANLLVDRKCQRTLTTCLKCPYEGNLTGPAWYDRSPAPVRSATLPVSKREMGQGACARSINCFLHLCRSVSGPSTGHSMLCGCDVNEFDLSGCWGDSEAEALLAIHGKNELVEKKIPKWLIYLKLVSLALLTSRRTAVPESKPQVPF
jgi:hypothetical protein